MDGMEIQWDDKERTLKVIFSGRLDALTSTGHEQKLFRALEGRGNDTCIVDLEKLGYISSGGLRLILDIKKRCEDMKIINVSLDIYDIISMAGFTKFITVERRIRNIKMPAPGMHLSRESDGDLYEQTNDLAVKIFDKGVSLKDVQNRLQMSKIAITHRIPTPIAFEVVSCDERYGIVYEKIQGRTLKELWDKKPDDMLDEIRMLAELLNTLRDCEIEKEELPDYRERMIEEIENKNSLLENEKQILIRFANPLTTGNSFIHGNLRLCNIIKKEDQLILLDLKRCGYGNPVLDLQAAASGMYADGHAIFWKRFFGFYTRNLDADKRMLLEKALHPEIKPWW